jgi:hypothetical protein
MTDFSKTNIHCSSIGLIMSNGRGKTNLEKWQSCIESMILWEGKYNGYDEKKKGQATGLAALKKTQDWKAKAAELEPDKDINPLSIGAKSHLKKIYGYEKYGKWSALSDKGTKFTNKGTLAEIDSIRLISELQGINYQKNEERVQNEFLTGIPDVFVGKSIYEAEYIIDIKSSWDIQTFLDTLGKPLYNLYWWQIQGYLAITGAKIGEVSYCLVDTPTSILNGERRRLLERMDAVTEEDPAFLAKDQELINNMTFGDMPKKDRRIRFLVERDEEAIQKIYSKVTEARKYLQEIEELHQIGEFLAKEPSKEEPDEENEVEETE